MQIVLLSLENLHLAEKFKQLAGLSETHYCEMRMREMSGMGKNCQIFFGDFFAD